MGDLGASHILVKALAENDNSKNQIYLGGNFQAVNVVPHGPVLAETKQAKAPVSLHWLDPEGGTELASGAQLIFYPQYPEIRLSGFLKGCRAAPSKLLAERSSGRRLFLGIHPRGKVFAWACGPDDPLAREIADLEWKYSDNFTSVFFRLSIHGAEGESDQEALLRALAGIARKGWIPGERLRKDGQRVATASANAGGYTLEAAFGISANSDAAPDFRGWELKGVTSRDLERPPLAKAVTVITPEPKIGIYATEGVETFIRRYGYADRNGVPDRLNFGGQYRLGKRVDLTGLHMELPGYDTKSATGRGKITDFGNGSIALVDDEGTLAAGWRFTDFFDHWQRKHANAAYVPMLSAMGDDGVRRFKYSSDPWLGIGTEFLKFLDALAYGEAYYDPGVKMEGVSSAKPAIKRRSQFRVKFKDLGVLYSSFERAAVDAR